MPLRSALLTKRWATVDLPILPFLAHRVFTPWPQRNRRAHSSNTTSKPLKPEGKDCWETRKPVKNMNHDETPPSSFQPFSDEISKLLEKQAKGEDGGGEEEFDDVPKGPDGFSGEIRKLFDEEAQDDGTREAVPGGSVGHDVVTEDISKLLDREAQGGRTGDGRPADKPVPSYSTSPETNSRPFDVVEGRKQHPVTAGACVNDKVLLASPQTASNTAIYGLEVEGVTRQMLGGKLRPDETSTSQGSPRTSYGAGGARRYHTSNTPDTTTWKPLEPHADGGFDQTVDDRTIHHENSPYFQGLEGVAIYKPLQPLISKELDQILEKTRSPDKGLPVIRHSGGPTIFKRLDLQTAMKSDQLANPVLLAGANDEAARALQSLWNKDSSSWLRAWWKKLPNHLHGTTVNNIIWHYLGKQAESLEALVQLPPATQHLTGADQEPSPEAVSNPEIGTRQEVARKLLRPTLHILRNTPLGVSILTPSSIAYVLKNLDTECLKTAWQELKVIDYHLNERHFWQLIHRFTTEKELDLATEVLKLLHLRTGNINDDAARDLTTKMLMWRYRGKSRLSDAQLLTFMLDRGLKPTAFHYSELLHNSIIRRDHTSGWHIYNRMVENNIQPTGYTYSILLNNAKSRMDLPSIQRIMTLIAEDWRLGPNHIAADHLDIIFRLYQQEEKNDNWSYQTRANAFDLMLPVFCQYFPIDPLIASMPALEEQLRRVDLEEQLRRKNIESNQQESWENRRPAPIPVAIMFKALIWDINDPARLLKLYQDFRQAVLSDEPPVQTWLDNTSIYDCFIKALGHFPTALHLCPAIVEDMIKTPPVKRTLEKPPWHIPGPPLTTDFRPIPNVYTWTVLLASYMRNKQPHAAEKVFQMMQARGIAPADFTYELLISGYRNLRDAVSAAAAVDRMKDAGYDPDGIIKDSFTKFPERDGRKFIAALRAMEYKRAAASDAETPQVTTREQFVRALEEAESDYFMEPMNLQVPEYGALDTQESDNLERLLDEATERDASWERKPPIPEDDWMGEIYG